MTADACGSRISVLVERLRPPAEPEQEAAARAELFEITYGRMQTLAHRMIRGFPQVRRWDDTADVVQAAGLRLHRALGDVHVRDARHLLRLAALQIRRELLDLARKHGSPESPAVRHETNAFVTADGTLLKTDLVTDETAEPPEVLESWSRFHDVIAELPQDDREIFDLIWFMGATQSDVAAVLGSSSRTVRRQWESIKHRIKVALGRESPSP